ncbi:MAG: TetR/AcrR family transcriptional regulator [Clostridia bacterium]|nr:TetR/AcrR family transcriptional regulator [Clostridia bacterium]
MEKAKKTELTQEKIFAAALKEFGTEGYKGSSLNNICKQNKISKGLIYHNFKNKDEIYLLCVEYSINYFIAYFKNKYKHDGIKSYLSLRNEFFAKNPILGHIFFEAVLQPPKHLSWDIKLLTAPLSEYVTEVYMTAVKNMKLREGISTDDAMAYCKIINEVFNGYYNTEAFEGATLSKVISDYEEGMEKILDMLFYGIAEKGAETEEEAQEEEPVPTA